MNYISVKGIVYIYQNKTDNYSNDMSNVEYIYRYEHSKQSP